MRQIYGIIEEDGALAEWLRSGLQNRVHRFNSGRHLHFLSQRWDFLLGFLLFYFQKYNAIIKMLHLIIRINTRTFFIKHLS